MNYNLIQNYIKPTTLVDIGAHVGEFTTNILKISPECNCFLIEANPNCEVYLEKLKQPYSITTLSSDINNSNLYIENINKIGTGTSIYKENTQFYSEGKYHTISITTNTLDSLNVFPNQMIDLIKIDTQGSELDILIGGNKTIKRTKYVLLEVSVLQYNQNSPLVDQIVEKMREYHFKIEDIIDYAYMNNQIFQMDFLFKNRYI